MEFFLKCNFKDDECAVRLHKHVLLCWKPLYTYNFTAHRTSLSGILDRNIWLIAHLLKGDPTKAYLNKLLK